jgi:hypothetical protein
MDLPGISNDHFQGGQEQREVGRQKVGQRTRIESGRPRGAYLRHNGQAEHARKRATTPGNRLSVAGPAAPPGGGACPKLGTASPRNQRSWRRQNQKIINTLKLHMASPSRKVAPAVYDSGWAAWRLRVNWSRPIRTRSEGRSSSAAREFPYTTSLPPSRQPFLWIVSLQQGRPRCDLRRSEPRARSPPIGRRVSQRVPPLSPIGGFLAAGKRDEIFGRRVPESGIDQARPARGVASRLMSSRWGAPA